MLAGESVEIVVAPRFIHRISKLKRGLRKRGIAFDVWSRSLPHSSCSVGRLVLVDTIGDLPTIYAGAHLAFVGGSWVRSGGHNLLEPAATGCPVFFGPHVYSHRAEAKDLIRAGGGRCVESASELAATVLDLRGSQEFSSMCEAALSVAASYRREAEKTLHDTVVCINDLVERLDPAS